MIIYCTVEMYTLFGERVETAVRSARCPILGSRAFGPTRYHNQSQVSNVVAVFEVSVLGLMFRHLTYWWSVKVFISSSPALLVSVPSGILPVAFVHRMFW